ncbi:type 1 glutamine amidotransferase family protein [Gluconobacter sphaericus]|uniref:DJ-1/PfpI domain-containing protein n=1 Tax=Gluconobacter sphaericus NBRC 12467 TaxID=1307951 RepID=A0AA37WAD5_9PROT|nr:hypothetical protein [Gluconobacter sphaericus]MBS1084722.1 hypothetical protein [Gluconobacter sphaericus]MBS1099892.1 hypothetical protein [Gluconobacter sphaericus]GLQ83514.1 hypothetical protein GCM10007872_04220 [Gluconobacter sphaericus NBRC 12467]
MDLAIAGLEKIELTGPPDALEKAGATWVDNEVVIDGTCVFSCCPDDIPAFNKVVGRHSRLG